MYPTQKVHNMCYGHHKVFTVAGCFHSFYIVENIEGGFAMAVKSTKFGITAKDKINQWMI